MEESKIDKSNESKIEEKKDLSKTLLNDMRDSFIELFNDIDQQIIKDPQNKEYVISLLGKDFFSKSTFESFKEYFKAKYNLEIEWEI